MRRGEDLILGQQEYGELDMIITTGVGRRAGGAGVKLVLKELFTKTQDWHTGERVAGNFAGRADLFTEWVSHANKLQKDLKDKKDAAAANPELEVLTPEGEEQLSRLNTRFKYLVNARGKTDCAKEIATRIGAYAVMPQSLSVLTSAREAHRFKSTLQCQDEMMWIIAFGQRDELSKHVSNPDVVIASRKSAVLLFSDQVCWWVNFKNQDGQIDKYRITLVLLQIVKNFFDAEVEPLGEFSPSVLILLGPHAQLSNIDDEHCFIEDRVFVSAGKRMEHKKGQKTALLEKVVEMRKKAELDKNEKTLEYLKQFRDIVQQPSGFQDAIISTWIIELLAKYYTVSLHQRDMFIGNRTRSSKEAMYKTQQFSSWIPGKMGPACQITNSDVACSVKAHVRVAENEFRKEMKSFAADETERPTWTCGPYELVKICGGALINSKLEIDNGGILAAGVRNGQLSWRPDLKKGKLVKSDEQEWHMALRTKAGIPVRLGSPSIHCTWTIDRYNVFKN